MLKHLGHLTGATVNATDGTIGHLKGAFFDDSAWVIRYLVVDTGTWLSERAVLISPYSVTQPLGSVESLDVSLTRAQVRDSPDIDTHRPVSRQHEREYMAYYALPEYWCGGALWGVAAYPLLPAALHGVQEIAADRAKHQENRRKDDIHLRSSSKVAGYEVRATDERIGHIEDFVFDDESWVIRYVVVDTRNGWPGGRKVLVAVHWIERIDWATSTVHVTLTRAQVRNSPEYNGSKPLGRGDEERLHEACNREGYWA